MRCFQKYYDGVAFNKPMMILTNEKNEMENILNKQRVVFKRLLNKEKQYNIYLLSGNWFVQQEDYQNLW